MSAKKATAKKVTAKKATAKKVTAKKVTAKKVTAKKVTAKKVTAKKVTAKKATAKKVTPRGARRSASQPKTTPSPRAASSSGSFTKKVSRGSTPAEPGDSIVIDSHQVGSTARTGEVVEVIRGEAGVSYWVRWADGHQTLIAPKGGSARIVRASDRA